MSVTSEVDAHIEAVLRELERIPQAQPYLQKLQFWISVRNQAVEFDAGKPSVGTKRAFPHDIQQSVIQGRYARDLQAPSSTSGKMSVLAAVHQALRDAGHPLSTNQLLERIPQYGAESGGADPKKNLVSQLSGKKTQLSKELVSINLNGMYVWWFDGRPLPSAKTAGAGQSNPAASSTTNQGDEDGTALAFKSVLPSA